MTPMSFCLKCSCCCPGNIIEYRDEKRNFHVLHTKVNKNLADVAEIIRGRYAYIVHSHMIFPPFWQYTTNYKLL
jgi:hypothetical protein